MPHVEEPADESSQKESVSFTEDDTPGVTLRITEAFVEDTARVYSPRLVGRIRNALLMLQNNPDIGSPLARESLVKAYGPNIRTFALSSFVLVYRHNKGFVDILGLVYGPTIR
jgi:plasmid stabilization system protein ParE